MIELLTGNIIKKYPSYLLLDVNDIGYKINISIIILSLNNQKGAIDGILTRQGFEY